MVGGPPDWVQNPDTTCVGLPYVPQKDPQKDSQNHPNVGIFGIHGVFGKYPGLRERCRHLVPDFSAATWTANSRSCGHVAGTEKCRRTAWCLWCVCVVRVLVYLFVCVGVGICLLPFLIELLGTCLFSGLGCFRHQADRTSHHAKQI